VSLEPFFNVAPVSFQSSVRVVVIEVHGDDRAVGLVPRDFRGAGWAWERKEPVDCCQGLDVFNEKDRVVNTDGYHAFSQAQVEDIRPQSRFVFMCPLGHPDEAFSVPGVALALVINLGARSRPLPLQRPCAVPFGCSLLLEPHTQLFGAEMFGPVRLGELPPELGIAHAAELDSLAGPSGLSLPDSL
jgi:hypothetical protein